MSYDNNYLHDHLSDEMATYAAKHEALSTQIRLNLNLSDYLKCIECDASFDTKCTTAISEAFKTGADCGAILNQYANDWLANHADKLATQRLNGEME